MQRHALVVDDLPEMVELIREHLEDEGFTVHTATTGAQAIQQVNNGFKGVVVLDLQLPDMNGMEVFRTLLDDAPYNPVIVLTAYASFEQVAEAIRLGAFDFISKTDEVFEHLGDAVSRAWGTLRPDEHEIPKESGRSYPTVVGQSSAIQNVMKLVHQVVNTRVTVLLEGESGTGKEVIARAIHDRGNRAAGPFVAINCAGIPASLLESELFGHERGAFTGAISRKLGKFEQANGGTVFLDEVGELDMAIQSKLLRVLQEKEVVRIGGSERIRLDVRIVSATNRDLGKEVEEIRFRSDLFYRLAVFRIRLPPLRERMDDLPLLVDFILRKFAANEGMETPPVLSKPAMSLLEEFPFPGNVRELENILAYAAVVARDGQVGIYDLPESVHEVVRNRHKGKTSFGRPSRAFKESREEYFGEMIPTRESVLPLDELTDAYMRHVVAVCGGNITQASKRLGVARQTLYRRLPELKDVG